MQDEYVGDIGDYGKYALLRWLAIGGAARQRPGLRLGIVWYRTNHAEVDRENNGDGRHLGYLESPRYPEYRLLSPSIWKELGRIAFDAEGNRRTVANGRTVWAVMRSRIFDPGTVFYDKAISFAGTATTQRLQRREEWLQAALAATAAADFVFLDPDNGFQVEASRTSRQGLKFCFYDEVRHFLHRRQSVVVYQHYARGAKVGDRAAARLKEIKEGCECDAVALGFSAWQHRYFYLLPAGSFGRCLGRRAEQFVANADNVLPERWTVHRP